jgi:Acetyltransferase (GNAT) domain
MVNIVTDDYVILRERPKGELERAWLQCLDRAKYAGSYSAPSFFDDPWMRDRRPFAVLVRNRDGVAAILTGHHENRQVRCGLSVRPQLCWAANADLAYVARSVEAALVHESAMDELVDVFTWEALPVGGGFRCSERPGVVMLDLSAGPEALFRKFSENKRTNIKKAIKKGVSVDMTTDDRDIASFYEITEGWARRKAIEVPDRAKFVEAFKMTDVRRLFVARHAGDIVAGVIVRYHPNGLLEYAANSSNESSLHLRPNDLLHWRAIEWACALGLQKYSLCGTHLFLRKFGGPLVPTYRYRLDRSFLRRHLIGDLAEEVTGTVVKRMPPSFVDTMKQLRDKIRGRP